MGSWGEEIIPNKNIIGDKLMQNIFTPPDDGVTLHLLVQPSSWVFQLQGEQSASGLGNSGAGSAAVTKMQTTIITTQQV